MKTGKHLIIEWDALLIRNSNIVAWIYVPGTNINFPVLQGENNDTYLRHNIDGEFSIAGSIFVDSANSPSFTDLGTIIHGHNMRNDTMFSQVADLANGTMTDIPSHIYIYLPDGTLNLYKIVSINRKDISSALFNEHTKSLDDYLDLITQGSVVNIEFDTDTVERVLILSTCGDFAQNTPLRAVIYAILIDEKDYPL